MTDISVHAVGMWYITRVRWIYTLLTAGAEDVEVTMGGRRMTREEILEGLYEIKNWKCNGDAKTHEVVAEAIKLLEQESTTKIEESNFSQEQYLADIQSAYDCGKSVINKIRTEIENHCGLIKENRKNGKEKTI